MFAVAIWDAANRRLVLARDRFGIKPLFVEPGRRPAAHSRPSSRRSLPGMSGEVDLDALQAFLAFNSIPAPLTIFRAARKLPAGCVLVAEDVGGEGSVPISEYREPAAGAGEPRFAASRRPSSPRS